MDFTKKILIAIIIIILTYILWRLIKKRKDINSNVENFDISSYIPTIVQTVPIAETEIKNLKDTQNSVNIQSINSKYANLPLKEYCIKASFNSAFTGNNVSLDMVSYVLSRGCRFLDFEVFFINEKNLTIPKVGVSNDPKFMTMISENSLLLDNVLTTALSSGFSSTSPNNNDPLFINLRIKSNNNDVYHAVAKSIDYSLKSKLFKGKIREETTMKDIMGKVVLIIDKTINRKYLDYAICEEMNNDCYDLTKYTNLESGSDVMNLIHYAEISNQCVIPINIADDNLRTDVKRIKLLIPDMLSNQKNNIYFNPMVYKYGCQIVPYLYYFKDNELLNYEKFFNVNQGGIVQLSIALQYFKKIDQSQIQNVNL